MDVKLEEALLNPPKDFLFPFQPYTIQKEFMTRLYDAIENRKLGVFESPTGTGKSLSIICASLCWLKDHEKRNEKQLEDAFSRVVEKLLKLNKDDSDDWLNLQTEQIEFNHQKFSIQCELDKIKKNQDIVKQIRERVNSEKSNRKESFKKFSALNVSDQTNERFLDEDILLGDEEDSEEEELVEDEYEGTKILFCSRTHSQLSQFISEVKRSAYEKEIRLVPFASRQNYCINPAVKSLKTLSLINERCLELQKSVKLTSKESSNEGRKKRKCTTTVCSYYKRDAIDKLADEIIAEISDVEDLIAKGQKTCGCPYYASRKALTLSQLVVVPYNTLLHKSTREASKIKLKGNVVIIDEAHNLLDAIGNMYSSHVTGGQLIECFNRLSKYKERYEKLFSALNLLHLEQLIFVIRQFIYQLGGKSDCKPTDTTTTKQGGGEVKCNIYNLVEFKEKSEIDGFNIYKLIEFCKRSKIGQKLQGFAQRYPYDKETVSKTNENGLKSFLKNISEANGKKNTKKDAVVTNTAVETSEKDEGHNNAILSVISFLESLTNNCEDGRIVCNLQPTIGDGQLKFLLLNPAAHFSDIVNESRAVIVAGGTMQPISEFKDQLFKNAGADMNRLVYFSCGHVIPKENILPVILGTGPSGVKLEFSFQCRNNTREIDELGRVLINLCNVVPGGVVCFFPSYQYEKLVYDHLYRNKVIEKIVKKKKVYREPKKTCDVESVLNEYAFNISKGGGSLLFSVVGGKLSEGLNFSDDLGRCVIVVGLPYSNIKSAELQEKMKYLDKKMGIGYGREHYENLCMKSVNQSVGRAVRHQNDYACVLLLDHRYFKPKITDALPKWMHPSIQKHQTFQTAFSSIVKFFKNRK